MKPNGLVIPPVPHSPSTTTIDAAHSFFKNLPPLFQQRNARDMCRKWNKIPEQSKKNPKNFQHLNENCSKPRAVNQTWKKGRSAKGKRTLLINLTLFWNYKWVTTHPLYALACTYLLYCSGLWVEVCAVQPKWRPPMTGWRIESSILWPDHNKWFAPGLPCATQDFYSKLILKSGITRLSKEYKKFRMWTFQYTNWQAEAT